MADIAIERISFQLTPSAEREVKKGHPWVFDKGIVKQNKDGQTGAFAVIYDKDRTFVGLGLYDPDSPIRIRMLHRGKPVTIDSDWMKDKISASISARRKLFADGTTTAFRLINGENDGLPGIIADYYEKTLVIKLDSGIWIPYIDLLTSLFDELLKPECVILRLSRSIDIKKIPEKIRDGAVLKGAAPKGAVIFRENGILFEAEPIHGQKTGFFLDQRDNRARVEKYAKNRDVLNVFSYTGGFSLYAARGGASSVISLDVSEPALKAANRNFELNKDDILISECRHSTICMDAFEALTELAKQKKRFSMVIVDPPSFARKQSDAESAVAAYQKLTRLAVGVLDSGGILVSASCSARVTSQIFFDAVSKAAAKAGRPLQIMQKTGHAADHPVGFPEGEYLKCLFAFAK
ncbi:class I SAM-dependent rRNA methyltransferase [Geovibrio thiophilus]|uniref:Class I SAM-dependent rRNA methyltransferase n=1 Tax=Geovibrio thiophilus TaxID=139438 RepID=A0A410JW71_9BACT|nr:class I SAM-dependent rRNA methyltransferase [Geovibrio thiophilus]QAR32447.1 class I SAM-dependent rRNA methyltransferase [Geovibrio thiophilus]